METVEWRNHPSIKDLKKVTVITTYTIFNLCDIRYALDNEKNMLFFGLSVQDNTNYDGFNLQIRFQISGVFKWFNWLVVYDPKDKRFKGANVRVWKGVKIRNVQTKKSRS